MTQTYIRAFLYSYLKNTFIQAPCVRETGFFWVSSFYDRVVISRLECISSQFFKKKLKYCAQHTISNQDIFQKFYLTYI